MDDIVWARDHTEGYVLGRIMELMDDGAEVLPLDSKHARRTLPFSDIFRAQQDKDRDYDDNCEKNAKNCRNRELWVRFLGEMMFLNEGSLLNNIRQRYYKNKIYVREKRSKFEKKIVENLPRPKVHHKIRSW